MAKVTPTEKIWFDGKLIPWGEANFHVLTHALHYGMSVFEGIRAYDVGGGKGAVFRLEEHVRRLFDSAHILDMDVPYSPEDISKAIVETLKANRLTAAYIRPIFFSGAGEMGLYATNPTHAAIACWVWGAYLGEEGMEKGIRVKVSSFQRMHVNTHMTKSKAGGNYINSILAKREATRDGYDEAILLDTDGYVSEASGENVFIYRKGILKTPPLTSVLDGITRASILEIARDKGIKISEERFTRDEMYIADEMFLTGTAAEITPVREVDGRKIGANGLGDVTKAICKTFFDAVRGKSTQYKHWLTVY
ncbi:MAG: branched-chain amino acid transaminase [Bdellovibrionota bacterium]